ncbi:hypothetical protein KQY27_03260 [Methanobrevibacter sp. TMH8]|uniref:hypothetical protein n=1 Tax=Methanobrevibacter sp. TMH8 TaxID=2848611 RepID=UPI001CCF063A|nr:hypothetical protein [Methanobrevibacter sp. TMH8]MBZ9570563.1 hypothetical protein [Methanobrevibacter sp. TMH8]
MKMNKRKKNNLENENVKCKMNIKLTDEISLLIEPNGKKAKYIFKRNGNEYFENYGEKPSSLTIKTNIGKEIVKSLDPENELKKEILIKRFDEFKENAQKLFEKNIKTEKLNKENEKKRKKESLELKKTEAGNFYKDIDMPLIWIKSLIGWLTAGEEINILQSFLAYCCQVIFGLPISIIYVGDGSTGKDHIKKTAFTMIPEYFIIMEKLVSEAAIFRRSQQNPYFYDGKIVDYGDLGGENSHEETENSKALMKELQSDAYLNKPILVQFEGEWIPRDLELIGKPALTYTTVPNYCFDDQDKSRSIFISPRIDNQQSFEKRYRILGFKGETFNKLKMYQNEVKKIKDIVCHLRDIFRTPEGDMKIEIINPYIEVIMDMFKDSPTFKRDISKYENILKVICALNYYKKTVYEHNGRKVIYVSLEDLQLFLSLLNENIDGIKLNISPKALNILKDLQNNFDVWVNNGNIAEEGFTVADYHELGSIKLQKRSIYTYFKELRDLGSIKINHKEGPLNFYVLSDDVDFEQNTLDFNDIDREEIISEAGEEIKEFLDEDSPIDGLNINNHHDDIEVPPWN